MPVVRFTAFFRDDDGHGWSEQHDYDAGSTPPNLTVLVQQFDNLMKTARRPLLAGDGFYIGCRASYRTDSGKIAAAPLLNDPAIPGTQTIGNTAIQMNTAEDAVKVRIQNATSTGNTDIYLRGVWDSAIEAGVLAFGSAHGKRFRAALDVYFDALRAGAYGWVGIDTALTSRGVVSNYTADVNGIVTFTVAPTNGVVLPAVGTRLNISFSRLNGSNSVLNRSLLCTVASPTSLVSVKPIAAGTFVSSGTYIAPVRGFIAYDHVAYYKVSSRKTGRPFGVGRGRLPARKLV